MTDQQDWDAATEAGYLPVSDYVERWATARHARASCAQRRQLSERRVARPRHERFAQASQQGALASRASRR